MSVIEINLTEVLSNSKEVKKCINSLNDVKDNIKKTRNNLYYKTRNDNEIVINYNKVNDDLDNIKEDIKKLSEFLNSSVKIYQNTENKIFNKSNSSWFPFLDNVGDFTGHTLSGHEMISVYNSTMVFKGIRYKFIKDDNGILKLIVDNKEKLYNKSVNYLKNNEFKSVFGENQYINKKFLKELKSDGVKLFNYLEGSYLEDSSKILASGNEDLLKYFNESIDKVTLSGEKHFFKSMWNGAKESAGTPIKNITEFGSSTTGGKVIKGLGVLGDGLMVFSNVQDNFYNQETGQFEFNGANAKEFIVDTGVDFGMSIGASALGAGVGSLFFPPVGTVVGAAAGIAIDLAFNAEVFGDPPKSVVDCAKDFANDVVDGAVNLVNGIADGISGGTKWLGNKVSSLFW